MEVKIIQNEQPWGIRILKNKDQKKNLLGFSQEKWDTAWQNFEMFWDVDRGWILLLDEDPQIAQLDFEKYQGSLWKNGEFQEKLKGGRVAVLGGGDGLFLKEALQFQVHEIDWVEWDRQVVEGFYPWAKEWIGEKVFEAFKWNLKPWIKKQALSDDEMDIIDKDGTQNQKADQAPCDESQNHKESNNTRPQAKFFEGDALEWILSVQDNQYDAIVVDLIDPQDRTWMNRVIDQKIIEHVFRALKPGGWCVWQTGSGRDFEGKDVWLKQWAHGCEIQQWEVDTSLQKQTFIGGCKPMIKN